MLGHDLCGVNVTPACSTTKAVRIKGTDGEWKKLATGLDDDTGHIAAGKLLARYEGEVSAQTAAAITTRRR